MTVSAAMEVPTLSVDLMARARRTDGEVATWPLTRLRDAENRYRMFLSLVSRHPHVPMAPTRDIDEMWHLHMLNPVAYVRDCNRILGYLLDHDGGFGATPEELQHLQKQFNQTGKLWEVAFGISYTDDATNCGTKCSHRCHTKCAAK